MTRRFIQVIFGVWAVWLAVDPIQQLAELPREIRMPVGVLKLAPGWLVEAVFSEAGLWAIRVGGVLLAGGCALLAWASRGAAWRWAALGCCVLLTVHQSVVRSFGHVNHAEIPLLLGAWVLALDAWLPADAPDAARESRASRRPTPSADGGAFVVLLVFCFSYALVAMHRFAVGGWSLWLSDRPTGWLLRSSSVDAYWPFGLGRDLATLPGVGQVFGVSLLAFTVLELLAPLAVVNRRIAWALIAGMGAFHLTAVVLLNLLFLENLILLGLLGYWTMMRCPEAPRHEPPA